MMDAITKLLQMKKYKLWNNKENLYVYKKCPYDLTEIAIEKKTNKYLISLPLVSNVHYKTSFEDFDELFHYIIKHLDYLEKSHTDDNNNNTRYIS